MCFDDGHPASIRTFRSESRRGRPCGAGFGVHYLRVSCNRGNPYEKIDDLGTAILFLLPGAVAPVSAQGREQGKRTETATGQACGTTTTS
jgi:hypothetical protein